ncbi:MAG: hypothetical protein FJX57_01235, partial [Alphaproteobacteria bacterium]|nr:hypothetical protein [Alphaproteobacteria bacterium]
DGLTVDPGNRLRWSLEGPDGAVVSNNTFHNADSDGTGGNPLLRLGAGAYKLTIDGTGDFVGDYRFRLIDHADATVVPFDEQVDSVLAEGGRETKLFAFDAVAGEALYFDAIAQNAVSRYVRIYRPDGELALTTFYFDNRDFTATADGRYVVSVEGHRYSEVADDAATFSFAINRVDSASTALTIGSTINGSLDRSGQRDRFTFTLASATKLYFDSLSNDGNLRWTLIADGVRTEIGDRAFNGSDSEHIGGNTLLDLAPGNYTLIVDGNADHTADYAYRLLNLSDVASMTAVTFGTSNTGTLSPGNETAVYRVDAVAGDQITITRDSLSAGFPMFRMFDPHGRFVFGPTYLDPGSLSALGTVTLRANGPFVLVLEGRVYEPGDISYGFTVNKTGNVGVTPHLGEPRTFGSDVTGTLTGSDTKSFLFNVLAPTRLLFDTLTDDSGKAWRLVDPNGLVIADRNLRNADSYEFGSGDASLAAPVAGTYKLEVYGSAGGFAFKLIDLNAAGTPVALNTTISDSSVRATDVFQFTGTTGDRLFFDRHRGDRIAGGGLPGDWATIRIYDPFGRMIVGPINFDDFYLPALPVTGTYKLVYENRVWFEGSNYAFALIPADSKQAITLGTKVDGSFDQPNQARRYTFTLTEDKYLYFDTISADANNNLHYYSPWTLSGPGVSVSRALYYSDAQEFGGSNPAIFTKAGTYDLTINGAGFTGDFSFRILDLSLGKALTVGTPITGSDDGVLSPINETDVYLFTATAGDRFFIDATTPTSNYNIRVLDPGTGQIVYRGTFDDVDTFTVSRTGTYRLLVEGRPWLTGASAAYGFVLRTVVDETAALTLGTRVDGTIDVGQVDRYSFTLASDRTLYFDSFLNDSRFVWSLVGPTGTVASRNFQSSDAPYLDGQPTSIFAKAGSYTLTVDASGGTAGAYGFRLLDLASATPMTLGRAVSGQLDPATETDIHSFTAAAGTRIFVDIQQMQGADGRIRILDAAGNLVFGPSYYYNDAGPITLALGGTYRLLVEGGVYSSGVANYRINLQPVVDGNQAIDIAAARPTPHGPFSEPAQLGKGLFLTGADHIEVADGPATDLRDKVTVEAWINLGRFANEWMPIFQKADGIRSDGGDRAYGLWLNRAGYLHWVSADASGQQHVNTAAGVIREGDWTHVAGVIDRAAGVMKVYVNGVEAASGSIRTGLSVTNDKPLLLGWTLESHFSYSKFEGTIDDVRLWSTARTAGEIAGAMSAELTGTETGLQVYMKMEEATGAATIDNAVAGNPDGTVVDAFATLDGLVYGRITAPGEVDRFTFTLATGTYLYLDSFVGIDRLTARITGPDGLVVDRNLRNPESFEFGGGNPAFFAPAGNYTITIDHLDNTSAAYYFRLLDLSKATALTLGTPITGTMTPGNQTQAFKFDASAGDRVFIDQQSFNKSTNDTSFRLIDPAGRQVFGPVTFVDFDVTTLPLAGTYTLLVEGRIYSPQSANYRFAVHKVADAATPLVLGTANPTPGPIWTTAGKIGGGLDFTGVDRLEVAHGPETNLRSTITMEAWVNVERYSGEWVPLIYKGADGNDRTYSLWLNQSNYVWLGGTDTSGTQSIQTASNSLPRGVWNHIAGVLDRTTGAMRIYINGELKASSDALRKTLLADETTNPLMIGRGVEEQYQAFEGRLDEIRIWNVARSEAQILAAMNTTLTGAEAGLTVYLPLDETSGTSANNLVAGAPDATLVTGNPDGITGRIATPGQVNRHSFTLAAGAQVYFDSLSENSLIDWSLIGPDGTITTRAFRYSDGVDDGTPSVFALRAGTYTIAVDGRGDNIGWYNFRLINLSAATPLALGAPTIAELNPASETALYKFAAAAGEVIFFDSIARNGDMYWRIMDPFGRQLHGATASDIQSLTLPYAGTYTALIEGRPYRTGHESLTFAIHRIEIDEIAMALGATVEGAIDTPGDEEVYTFSLTDTKRVVFDTFTDNSNMRWSLIGPYGTIINNRSFQSSDSHDISNTAPHVLSLVPGSYRLQVFGNNDQTGAYKFRLLEIGGGATLVPGVSTGTVSLNPGNETDVYSFTATDKGRYQIDIESLSKTTPSIRVIDPYGVVVIGQDSVADTAIFTTVAGRYTVLIEGRRNEASVIDYALKLVEIAQPAAGGATMQDFETLGGLPHVLNNIQGLAASILTEGTNEFLRLAYDGITNTRNTIGFSAAGAGPFDSVTVEFDFRMQRLTGTVANRADGIGFVLLDSSQHGTGGVIDWFGGVEPNAAGAFGLGLDVFSNSEVSNNHVSLHFAGSKRGDFNVAGFDLANGLFNNAKIVLTQTTGGALVDVVLTPNGGAAINLVSGFFIGGLSLNQARMAFSGQTGGNFANHDIDNVKITTTAGAGAAIPLAFDVVTSGTIGRAGAI